MSLLYIEHVSGFFLLLEKTEVLSETSKALATHQPCLLPFSFPFSALWLPDLLLLPPVPGPLHMLVLLSGKCIRFSYLSVMAISEGGLLWIPLPLLQTWKRPFSIAQCTSLSMEAFLQLWFYIYSCDWLMLVSPLVACSRRLGTISALLCSWTLRVWSRIWLLLTIDEYFLNEWMGLDWGLQISGHCSLNAFMPWDLSMLFSGKYCTNVKTWSFKLKDYRLNHYHLKREIHDRSQYFPNLKPREISFSSYFVSRNTFSDRKKADLCFVYYLKQQS